MSLDALTESIMERIAIKIEMGERAKPGDEQWGERGEIEAVRQMWQERGYPGALSPADCLVLASGNEGDVARLLRMMGMNDGM